MQYFTLPVVILLVSLFSNASELRMTKSQALANGFVSEKRNKINSQIELPKNSLPWPVRFIDSRHTIGNSMPEYQNYADEAYYHGGTDLRVPQEANVIAPVDGFLEGNYYSYVTDPNTGEDKKYVKPISEGGDELYFELTIKTEDGFLIELHHVNPKNLPKNINDLILNGGGKILHGEIIGHAAIWPNSRLGDRYDHIHYNIISPSGVRLNPEYYSLDIPDNSIPIIKNIFAVYKNKKIEILNQKLPGVPDEIIVSAIDMKGENIYPLPPVFVQALCSENIKIEWDFSRSLLNNSQSFPDIREVFARNLKLTDGRTFTTKGDYSNTQFLFRLKIPSQAKGSITLKIKDASGNENTSILNIIPN